MGRSVLTEQNYAACICEEIGYQLMRDKTTLTEILTKLVAVLCHCQSLGVSTIELLLEAGIFQRKRLCYSWSL